MPTTPSIDLSQLPAPDIIETLDFETIVAEMTADLIARAAAVGVDLTETLASEAEPLVKLIEVCAYRETVVRARVNQGARAVMLAFATGTTLDNIVANLDVQRLAGELDPALRARAWLSPESWSVAGPYGAYESLAMNASAEVSDVYVSSPTPGAVRVAVLSTATDGVADSDLLALVTAALDGDDVVPLTDNVTVVSAAVSTFNVTATLYIASGLDSATVQAAAEAAVAAYAAGCRKLNTGVAVAGCVAALMAPGVKNLVMTSPAADIEAVPESAPVLGTVTLTMVVGGDGV